MRRTVKQVARASGVSVRTLHHYDAIGLLKPAEIGGNGYRYYGRDELLRLQQILFFRELGFSLPAIATALDDPAFDLKPALLDHREALARERCRLARLIRTIDQTINTLDEETAMKDEALFEGFSAEKQAASEAYVVERYGADAETAIEAGKARMVQWSEADKKAFLEEIGSIEAELADAMADGAGYDSDRVRESLKRHHAWVARSWPQPPSADAYAGLADLYLEHPDFVARYEAIRPGFARWLADAMRAYARDRLA
jgi:DNA-binding transcriptional MerR regulator